MTTPKRKQSKDRLAEKAFNRWWSVRGANDYLYATSELEEASKRGWQARGEYEKRRRR